MEKSILIEKGIKFVDPKDGRIFTIHSEAEHSKLMIYSMDRVMERLYPEMFEHFHKETVKEWFWIRLLHKIERGEA